MLHFILFEYKLYQILFLIISYSYYIRLFVFTFKTAINFYINEFDIGLFVYTVIRWYMNPFICLYYLFCKLIQTHHIANFKIRPSIITMMCKAMFSYITMSGK